jgi:putative cardiolipin synthase
LSQRRRIAAIVFLGVTVFFLASLIALYSYGRSAGAAVGPPGFALPVADDATPLDRIVSPLVRAHPRETGLMLLSDNLHAYAARAHTARMAQRSLDLQYYFWKDDLTGGLLFKEVLAAADRGVRVRLLFDDMQVRGDDPSYRALDSHPNIEVRLFNPSRTLPGALARGIELTLRAVHATRRMHNKAWIADGRIAIIGGRNIGDAYFDAAETTNFRDMDVLMIGSAVDQTAAHFDRFWNSAFTLPLAALGGTRPKDTAGQEDAPAMATRFGKLASTDKAAPYLKRLKDERDTQSMLRGDRPIHWTAKADIVSDPPGKMRGEDRPEWLINTLKPAVAAATSELQITSPYFIPGDDGVDTLLGRVKAGVRVTVLTNSLAATDVAAVHGGYAPYREPLLAGGIRLFELRPQIARPEFSMFGSSGASLHTKAFTVDRKRGFIGSFNFDPRSESLNTEMGVLFEHPALAEEIRAIFEQEISPKGSYRVTLADGKLVWNDEGKEPRRWTHEPEAGVMRRLTAIVVRWLPIESQL